MAQIDLDRIEVVKGPVDGLYRRAAYAGAINYVSKVPDGHLEGFVSGTIGDQGQRRITGVIGLPIIKDILAVRVGGYYEGYDGGYTDQVNGLKAGGFNQRATIQSEVAYGPEKNKTYEIGAKTSWFDRALAIDVSAFLVDTTGFQYRAFRTIPPTAAS